MTEKEPRKKPQKKYTRREFLKYTGRVGAGVVIGGAIGNLIGRGYDYLIKPPIEAVYDMQEKVEDLKEDIIEKPKNYIREKYEDFKRFIGTETEKEQTQRNQQRQEQKQAQKEKEIKEEKEKLSRRGFFRKMFAHFHKHPVVDATIAGATYGGLKTLIKKYPKYLTKKRVAVLRDENVALKEKVSILEQTYQEVTKRLETIEDKYEQKSLENAAQDIQKTIEGQQEIGGLEDITKEDDSESKTGNILMILGGLGLLSLIITQTFTMTGNWILESTSKNYSLTTILTLVISITLLIIGIWKKRKKKK